MVESSGHPCNQNNGAGGYCYYRSIHDDYRDELGNGGISNRYGGVTIIADIGGRSAGSGGIT